MSLSGLCLALLLPCWLGLNQGEGIAQLHDSLDTHPPRWHLAESDCRARVVQQGHLAAGGVGGGACEEITFVAANGTTAILIYPIEPARPIDDLRANLSVMSAKTGARIGMRVRFPFLRDRDTRQAVSVVIYGASYENSGEFASIGVGRIERPLRLKGIALRNEYGSGADLSDPYVDGIVVNAYSGPGKTSLRLDELRVDGLVPVDAGIVTGNARSSDPTRGAERRGESESFRADPDQQDNRFRTAFPAGKITRILEHNGEPLAWIRSLGFDAVLLSKPPDATILSEAIRSRMLIYAPAPSSPDPALEKMLDPVAGWYIGMGGSMDSRHVERTALQSERLRAWPQRWRRPIVAAPSEWWRRYAPHLDAIIDDLPPRVRGLQADEEVAQMVALRQTVGDRVDTAVGVLSMPPQSLLRQTEGIAAAIGAPSPLGFRWHSLWVQVMRSLEVTPSAILFRSTRSLASGSPLDSQRSMALSYINRMVASVESRIAGAQPSLPPVLDGARYRSARLTDGSTDLLVLTSTATRGSEVLSGDGAVVNIQLTPADALKNAWRITPFVAERMQVDAASTGPRLQIVSPDAVELIVLSADPSMGGRCSRSAERFARQAALDRWQLATDLVQRTGESWTAATAARAIPAGDSNGLITAAQQTLARAESVFRSGDTSATLRMARRADAWALRSQWQLTELLMPHWPRPTSCPPIDSGATDVQIMWSDLMGDPGWGSNRLTSGGLDDDNLIGPQRWNVGTRMPGRVMSEVNTVKRGAFLGGALRATATPLTDEGLPGGYEGTVIQIRSPAVRVPSGKAIRIDALVRTVGFGGPHQGVLVYDNIGGQEAGVLVRGRTDWTPVRLYRQALVETPVQVMFELLGGGEAIIDSVTLRIWEPGQQVPVGPLIRPIAQQPAESTTR